ARRRSRASMGLGEDWEVRYWTKALGVSEDRLRELVRRGLGIPLRGVVSAIRMRTRRHQRELRFFGTFLPFLRASDRPMAIACLRLFTLPPWPDLPRLSVPRLRRRMALFTSFDAEREYLRAMMSLQADCTRAFARCDNHRDMRRFRGAGRGDESAARLADDRREQPLRRDPSRAARLRRQPSQPSV